MKMKTTRMLGLSVGLVALLGSFQVASAWINLDSLAKDTRGCHGTIEMVLGQYKVPIVKMTGVSKMFGHPDQTRRKARNRMFGCAQQLMKQTKPGIPKACLPHDGAKVLGLPDAWAKLGAKNAMTIEATYLQQFLSGFRTPKATTVSFRFRSWGTNDNCEKLGAAKTKYESLGGIKTQPLKPKFPKKKYPSLREGKIAGQKVQMQAVRRKYNKTTMSKYGNKRERMDLKISVKGKYKTEAFAPFLANKSLLKARKKNYVGCGRHAAQHMLDFLGHPMSLSDIGKFVPLHKAGMAGTKLAQAFKKSNRQKPVLPMDLRNGLTTLLKSKNEPLRAVISAIKRKDTQAAIKKHAKDKGAVIALVKNGTHYVTAMGHWQPVFDKQAALGSFYTFSNGATKMYPHGDYNLQFNSFWSKFQSKKVAPSWVPNTLIFPVAK